MDLTELNFNSHGIRIPAHDDEADEEKNCCYCTQSLESHTVRLDEGDG